MNAQLDPLEAALRDHYESKRLDPGELALLRTAIGTGTDAIVVQPATASRRHRLSRRLLAVAAMLLCAAVGASVFHAVTSRSWDGRSAAEEIVRHHRQDLDPEYFSDSIAGLASQMPRLGFLSVDPKLLRAEALTVVGGRYCSLATVPALQARLRDLLGRTCTLYEMRSDPALIDGEVEEHLVGDVRVRLWREGELVFGLAQPR